MNYIHKPPVPYTRKTKFTRAHWNGVNPNHIHEFCCTYAFGTPHPSPQQNPTEGRSTSLEFIKKALSYFHPKKLLQWNPGTMDGNPTKSAEVNALINRVRKAEVRHQGVPSQARKEFRSKEIETIFEVFEKHPDIDKRMFLSAVFKYQYHLGARVDDSCKALKINIKPMANEEHANYAVSTEVCWSKNILEERSVSIQIMLGCGDRLYCTLVSTGCWLEYSIRKGWFDNSRFLFAYDGIDDPDNLKRNASDALREVLNDESLGLEVNGLKGTHSFRKKSTTDARENGCSRDEVDIRNRWK